MLCKALVLLVCFCFYSSISLADTSAPTNPTTTSPDTLDFSDGTITNPSSGCPSGTTAAQVNSSHWGSQTVRFGECVNTFAITYAINQALQGSGVSIDKVHYSWRYVMCFNAPGESGCNTNISNRVNTTTGEVTDDTYFDELQVVIEVTDSNGNVVETKTWDMDTWYQWNAANSHSDNEIQVGSVYWQIHEDNIEVYNHIDKTGTIRTPNSVGDVRFRINGYDKGNWDGYYGPVINNLQTWFTYRANPCNDTALYDPSCPGYATAYAAWEYDQNCAANALYDPGCPGYSTAYYNQQCSADPLYDSGCDGYATAYYNQQCSADPLYDSGCDGYEAAYLYQQCNLDQHYSNQCPYYIWAITTVTSGWGENKAGQGSDFIEIVKPSGTDRWWTLWYNESEIDDGEWVAKCQTYADGCEDAVITSITFNYNGSQQYAFLYTKDADGNTFIPQNGDKYKFMTETQFDTYCDMDNSLYSPMCEGYAAAYFTQQCTANPLYNSECDGYAAAYMSQQCSLNALYDSSCSGYAAAYLAQQCSLNPLHDSSCSGYATAYFNQQCSLNALYNSECPGYDTAYFNQQCSLDATYNSECPGYASAYFTQQCNADPLYDSACSGYDAAYFTQQCTANPLYNSECSGYDTAYFNQQCGLSALYNSECDGYAEAYLAQQCSINTLYDSSCNGYEEAYTLAQCSENPLYAESCEGYAVSYFNQQCSINPQYDMQCPGYQAPVEETADPVAIDNGISTGDAVIDSILATPDLPTVNLIPAPEPMPEPEVVVELPTVEIPDVGTMDTGNTMPAPEPLGEVEQIEAEVEQQIEMEMEIPDATQEQEESSSDVEQSMDSDGTDEDSSDPGSSEEDSSTEDTEGDTEEVTEESTEDEASDEENESSEDTNESENEEETTEEESTEEESTEEESSEEESTEEKPVVKKKTTKKLTKAQKEKAKKEKMKEIIKDKLKKLAEDVGKAQTLEAQQALQQIIAALINYVPGFNAYGELAIPGVDFYQSDEIYKDKKVPENLRGLRNGLASELLHKKMVDMQYEGMD